jgi:hypothetical protein
LRGLGKNFGVVFLEGGWLNARRGD